MPPPHHIVDHNQTKSAEFDVKVTVGAGMPTNRAFVYNIMMELLGHRLYRHKRSGVILLENMGLPIETEPTKFQ